MNSFKLTSEYKPKGDQPEAIAKLLDGLKRGYRDQTLLGVTGSGKTLTMANVIEESNRPALVISHNKTLAAQLYLEFKELFPQNSVKYFVSYYDYYQPEAYIPRTDTYIEKETSINDEIDRLRHGATSSILSRRDTIIVASVSCIYGIGSPQDYMGQTLRLKKGQQIRRSELLRQLINIQYERNDTELIRGRLRVKGDIVDIYPPYEDFVLRLEFFGNEIESIKLIEALTGQIIKTFTDIMVFPAKHFVTTREKILSVIGDIQAELEERVRELKKEGKELEAHRIKARTNHDIEMMLETGYCSGIENYSRYLSGREPGSPPITLIDYFPKDYLMFVDESHITLPQIRGMYNGDQARKSTLVEHGFRLPSAKDNRPLRFIEFDQIINQAIYVSATPQDAEMVKSNQSPEKFSTVLEYYEKVEEGHKFEGIASQIIRPTGLLDPIVEIRPSKNQIDNLMSEIRARVKKEQRILVTTLTKRMAEDLADYLQEHGIKVAYLHSDIDTLERPEILRDLRLGVYDVLVGINLLREGLDLPEVSLVVIIDADKEGFLRSASSLIQTCGRAARHQEGKVIMYADKITGSMDRAMKETARRREIQEEHNKKHGITPQTIKKGIRENMRGAEEEKESIHNLDIIRAPKDEIERIIVDLEKQMKFHAKELNFEKAAAVRDQIIVLRTQVEESKTQKKILGKKR
ncbi:TPA: excinuclease ABC subunit UvrB [candidate division CPR2 bacterium]|uniref:UvrABC system protein B n=1 Tax=candidate division CPR2 bacterium GW2011_GWC1_41_48 TaxID=1618344 RepID=A0A0G0W7S0_UNCC2|nr:MAG: UvrABC system protein B [candidate division CPR2 bacterium GW2011_GWC2_39_35]KKR29355.1 MAG: UvrABC system protein B [candidate division CPR2 bacterium GW2011_GWD2_39_7]KKS09010.1 MAG: UvrABC system protein B [candidate division CPR2 bacterium GW2011_GWC1_41_48]OGB71177.1 MAG: excinuclease ABC subunit B [candidate division CPR2 bacterium GWD2_39_7]HBG81915.1 excinuclease ABC subunit UvrB [candidate division CPR2 bacterium]